MADNFVAAGGFTPGCCGVGVKVPIYPVKGVHHHGARPPGRTVRMPIIDDGRLFGFVPLGDHARLRFSGSRRRRTKSGTLQAIVDNVIGVFPGFRQMHRPRDGEALGGVRDATGTPIWIARQSAISAWRGPWHLGWTMGCGSGQIMADMIAGRTPEIDMEGFALGDH
jgi:D-amino-acid dehydrogenase